MAHGWKPLVIPLADIGSLDHTAFVKDIVESCESEHLPVQQSVDRALDTSKKQMNLEMNML